MISLEMIKMYKLKDFTRKLNILRVYRCTVDKAMIGYIALLFMLYPIDAHQILCKNNDESVKRSCYYPNVNSSQEACCYNRELEYYYCCPLVETRMVIGGRRLGGIIATIILLIVLVLFLCIFCTKCPLNRVVRRYVRHRQAASQSDTEEAPPVEV